jgi:hypothetical protein
VVEEDDRSAALNPHVIHPEMEWFGRANATVSKQQEQKLVANGVGR